MAVWLRLAAEAPQCPLQLCGGSQLSAPAQLLSLLAWTTDPHKGLGSRLLLGQMADILLRYWLPWYDSILASPSSYIAESLKKTNYPHLKKRRVKMAFLMLSVMEETGQWRGQNWECGRVSQQHNLLSDDQNLLYFREKKS